MLALKILAWRVGYAQTGSLLASDSNSLSIRLSEQPVREELGLGEISKQEVGRHLESACAELAEMGAPIAAQVSPVVLLGYTRPVTVRRRRAPIVAFDIFTNWDKSALTPPKVARLGGSGWRRERSRARGPKPLPLLERSDNILPFPEDDFGFVALGALRQPDRT